MHVQQCLSLKSKYHDATASENGEPAAPANCGVVAADSLVAAKKVIVSAGPHRTRPHLILGGGQRRNRKDFAAGHCSIYPLTALHFSIGSAQVDQEEVIGFIFETPSSTLFGEVPQHAGRPRYPLIHCLAADGLATGELVSSAIFERHSAG